MVMPPSVRISRPPAMVPSRMARKVAASMRALPPTSSRDSRCCGRMPYFRGPKKGRLDPHEEQHGDQKVGARPGKAGGRQRHHRDLGRFHHADHARLVVLVGELAGRGGEQEERQDEDAAGDRHQHLAIESRRLPPGGTGSA
jgi:hypothetical protein